MDEFRSYLKLPGIPNEVLNDLLERYYNEITSGHKPTTQHIVLACTGLVASGKSTVTTPFAKDIGAVTLSSDLVRELFFQAGYNFKEIRSFAQNILTRLIEDSYNIFLDLNIATNTHYLDQLIKANYRYFIIHADPPEDFIKQKILSGNMKHELTFFAKDEYVYRAMLEHKENHLKQLPMLKERYGMWCTFDTSQPQLDDIVKAMRERFQQELVLL